MLGIVGFVVGRAGFENGDLQTRFGELLGGHAARGSGTYDDCIENIVIANDDL
jgi:hypothetical protein